MQQGSRSPASSLSCCTIPSLHVWSRLRGAWAEHCYRSSQTAVYPEQPCLLPYQSMAIAHAS